MVTCDTAYEEGRRLFLAGEPIHFDGGLDMRAVDGRVVFTVEGREVLNASPDNVRSVIEADEDLDDLGQMLRQIHALEVQA
jgi:hypothetical protein